MANVIVYVEPGSEVESDPDPEPVQTETARFSQPGLFATNDNDLSKRRLRKGIIILLGISLFLQTIAILTPWWTSVWFDSGSLFGETTTHGGIFYTTVCSHTVSLVDDDETEAKEEDEEKEESSISCETKSDLDVYRDAFNDASESGKLRMKMAYHKGSGRTQAWASMAAIGTLFMIIAVVLTIRKPMDFIKPGFIFGCVLSVIGIIMGEIIYIALVEIDFLNGQKKLKEYMHVGFPYSLFLYILACIIIFASCVLVFKCFCDDIKSLRQTIAGKEVVIRTEKKQNEDLRVELAQRNYSMPSPQSNQNTQRDYSQDMCPSPRDSLRSSRGVGLSPRSSVGLSPRSSVGLSPRSSTRPNDHHIVFNSSSRSSFELRDYDRHSSRSPRDHDRRSNEIHRNVSLRDSGKRHDRTRDSRDERSCDFRDERHSRHNEISRNYRDSGRSRHSDEVRSRDSSERHVNVLVVPTLDTRYSGGEDDYTVYPYGTRGDYMPVPGGSESETISNYP